MRELLRDGACWQVRESNSTRTPGSRGHRCLIFDSEIAVRRVWRFPEDWETLSDDALWGLTNTVILPPPLPEFRSVIEPPAAPAGTLATETREKARSLIAAIRGRHADSRTPAAQPGAAADRCRSGRCAMRSTVEAFAAAMRSDGLAPQDAIVLLKGAVTDGVGAAVVAEDPDAETVMRDAVSWGIAAYYAA